ncbi:hypothetical protein Tco_1571384 [Tanacetum coccineum]
MLVIKIFSERKKVFRERKKCKKIRAKRSDFQQEMKQYLLAENPTVTGGGPGEGGGIYGEVGGEGFVASIACWRFMSSRKERMAGPKENMVKVAEKEETGKFCGSPDGDESSEYEHSPSHGMKRIEENDSSESLNVLFNA